MTTPLQDMGWDRWAPWMVLSATIALAFKGIVAKIAYADGMTVAWILILRFVLAVPLFWLGERLLRGGDQPHLPLGRSEILACAGSGFLFFLATLCDFWALSLIDASLSRVILFTFPAFILIIAAIRRRSPPALREMMAFVVTYMGLVLVVQPNASLTMADWLGIGLSLGSALSYALFLTATQGMTKRLGTGRFTALSNSFTLIYVLPLPFMMGGLTPLPSAEGLAWAFVIAAFCTVIPFFLLFDGIRRWGAERAGLMTLSGPAITVGGAWLILGEQLNTVQWGGFLVVVAGIAVLQKTDRALLSLWSRARSR